MDMEFWAGRVHSGKPSDICLNEGGEEDLRAWFPCPFCYIEIEVPVLCTHLQEEHCFGLKNAVCPICAASLGKDPISHFILQHAQSVKRRRKHQKPGFQELIATDVINNGFNVQEPSCLDSHLFAFLPIVLPKPAQELTKSCDASSGTGSQSSEQRRSDPDQVENYTEKLKRATFFQELLASTIFLD